MYLKNSNILFVAILGAVSGASLMLDLLSQSQNSIALIHFLTYCLAAAAVGSISFVFADQSVGWVLAKLPVPKEIKVQHHRYSRYTFLVFSVFWLGAFGLVIDLVVIILMFILWLSLQIILFVSLLEAKSHEILPKSHRWIVLLFTVSGFAALIYQIVWQRVLFSAFGIDIESVTLVVSIFMFGLGIGSVVGGQLSKRYPDKLAMMFVTCEMLIGLFGLISIPLIKFVGAATVTSHVAFTGLAIYGLLSIPTLLMGATLPILVAFLHKQYSHVGKSVSTLYWVNTIGSAFACFVTANLLFRFGGLQSSVLVAATLNILIAIVIFTKFLRGRTCTASY